MAALTIQGVQAGPLMIRNYPVLVYVCYLSAVLAAIGVFLVEMLGMPAFPAILKIPYHYLYPAIAALIFLGAYINTSNMFGIYSMVFLALAGVLLNYCEIPGTPFMLSFVLGNMIESYFRRSLSYGSWTSFLSRPVSCIFILATIFSIAYPVLAPVLQAKRGEKKSRNRARRRMKHNAFSFAGHGSLAHAHRTPRRHSSQKDAAGALFLRSAARAVQ